MIRDRLGGELDARGARGRRRLGLALGALHARHVALGELDARAGKDLDRDDRVVLLDDDPVDIAAAAQRDRVLSGGDGNVLLRRREREREQQREDSGEHGWGRPGSVRGKGGPRKVFRLSARGAPHMKPASRSRARFVAAPGMLERATAMLRSAIGSLLLAWVWEDPRSPRGIARRIRARSAPRSPRRSWSRSERWETACASSWRRAPEPARSSAASS